MEKYSDILMANIHPLICIFFMKKQNILCGNWKEISSENCPTIWKFLSPNKSLFEIFQIRVDKYSIHRYWQKRSNWNSEKIMLHCIREPYFFFGKGIKNLLWLKYSSSLVKQCVHLSALYRWIWRYTEKYYR